MKNNSLKFGAAIVLGVYANTSLFASELVQPSTMSVEGISADGTKVVGNVTNPQDASVSIQLWTPNGISVIANQPFMYVGAHGISGDGNVIAGNLSFQDIAFTWTQATGFVNISNINSFNYITPTALSYDGSVIVGRGENQNNPGNDEAFMWTQAAGAVSLGLLGGGSHGDARGVSADGTIIVGTGDSTGKWEEAFRWTQGTGMVGLGTLNGGSVSEANGISSDGNVIVGGARNGANSDTMEPIKWTQSTGMVGLGSLNGGDWGIALATNNDGTVIVGKAHNGAQSNREEAFRWTQSTGLQTVEAWLAAASVNITGFSYLSTATGVSNNGNTIIGYGIDGNGATQSYIARVVAATTTPTPSTPTPSTPTPSTPTPSTPSTPSTPQQNGIVGLTDLSNSLSQTHAITSNVQSLNWLSMNGAHHRPLTDIATKQGENCGWISGDAGRYYRSANGYTGLFEIGACHDFESGIRFGVGVGGSTSSLDLPNNGHNLVRGQYVLSEIDYQVKNTPVLLSLLGVYGEFESDIKRGYAISGTQASVGNTNIDSYSIRPRVDLINIFNIGHTSFTPSISVTLTKVNVDAFQETGGSAPAYFNSQKKISNEVRYGITAKNEVTPKILLLGHIEAASYLDTVNSNVSGNANALGIDIPFSQGATKGRQNWVRVGAEMDYQIKAGSVLNVSSFYSTSGFAPDITAAFSYKYSF